MRRAVLVLLCVVALAAPVAALAHPLGNFTVNRFSRIEVARGHLYVRYVLDLAEIPTLQAGRIDASAYAHRLAAGVRAEVDGRPATLVAVRFRLAHPAGAAGLRTTRLEAILRGPAVTRATAISYEDTNYASRVGWKEIVVGAETRSSSDELRAYPKDELSSPLAITRLSARLNPSNASPPGISTHLDQAVRVQADTGFAALIGRGDLSALVILGSLGVALFWGAAHALSPGHGKTIVTAYLVGTRGTPKHAALLGLITTFTHTLGVFALGGVTLLLSQFIVPEELYPWINVVSGLLVVGIGLAVLRGRWRGRAAAPADGHTHLRMALPGKTLSHGAHSHGHSHSHGFGPHSHQHVPAEGSGLRGLVAVGVSGGLLPCPSALVVLLAAISLHRIAFGLVLILAFSVGLACTITAIGFVAVLAKRAFARFDMNSGPVRLLPAVSALVIVVAGIAMTARALPGVGF